MPANAPDELSDEGAERSVERELDLILTHRFDLGYAKQNEIRDLNRGGIVILMALVDVPHVVEDNRFGVERRAVGKFHALTKRDDEFEAAGPPGREIRRERGNYRLAHIIQGIRIERIEDVLQAHRMSPADEDVSRDEVHSDVVSTDDDRLRRRRSANLFRGGRPRNRHSGECERGTGQAGANEELPPRQAIRIAGRRCVAELVVPATAHPKSSLVSRQCGM